jgi:hypothetical protein
MKDVEGLSFKDFLVIPVEDRYESLQRIKWLPRTLLEFRERRAMAQTRVTEATRTYKAKFRRIKATHVGTTGPTGKPMSIDAAEDIASDLCIMEKIALDDLECKLINIDAYLDSLKDMNGLMKGEQGRWNRENDVQYTGDEE